MTLKELFEEKDIHSCWPSFNWIMRNRTLEEAWAKCKRGGWMLWVYQELYPNKIKELVLARAYCANTVRHLMQDKRSIKAIDVGIAFGKGKASKKELAIVIKAAIEAIPKTIGNISLENTSIAYAAFAAANIADIGPKKPGWMPVTGYVAATYASTAAFIAGGKAARTKNRLETANICRKYLKI